jgi:glycerophosphoryl diester phosphodiesterase
VAGRDSDRTRVVHLGWRRWQDPPKPDPEAEALVIGHRGASGYRPEHTLAAYELAAKQGADYIERTKLIDGVRFTGWFTEDFTPAELKTLRAKERIPQLRPQNTAYDGQFEVPTFQEVVDLRKRLSKQLRRDIGISCSYSAPRPRRRTTSS